MIVETHAHARAGLIGNPSDGYYGKTISVIVRNFAARVALWESPELEIIPDQRDVSRSCGACAHFSGSGGALLGIRPDEAMFTRLSDTPGKNGCTVIRPQVS